MICWAVPSSLGPRDLESVWADPVENVWDEGDSEPVVGSDRGMTSMASAVETERWEGIVNINKKKTLKTLHLKNKSRPYNEQ